MTDTLPVAEIRLSPEEICIAARILWGSRFDAGSEGMSDFLCTNHRNALKFMSGERSMGPDFSRRIIDALRTHIRHGTSPASEVIRLAIGS